MINEELLKLADKCERELKDIYDDVEHISMFNSLKVLDAFKKNSILVMAIMIWVEKQ